MGWVRVGWDRFEYVWVGLVRGMAVTFTRSLGHTKENSSFGIRLTSIATSMKASLVTASISSLAYEK